MQADTVPSSKPAGYKASHRTVIGALWLFATLNYIYCDILGFYWAEHLRSLMDGRIGTVEISQVFLLGGGVLMTLPIAGVLITRIAPHGLARWYSVCVGLVMTGAQIGSLATGVAPTLHYIYFSIIEIATTLVIAYIAALRWKADG